jgi:hypothetical protein
MTDTWSTFTSGTIGAFTATSSGGYQSTRGQLFLATALGATPSDQFGMAKTQTINVSPGLTYTLSADIAHALCEAVVQIIWLDSSLGFISAAGNPFATPTGVWTRRVLTATAPAGAAKVQTYFYGRGIAGGPYNATLDVDNVVFEQSATASPWPGLPTLLKGDFIATGGQLFQVAQDVQFVDSGNATVPVVNRVRATIAVDSAVTWYRPTCDMVMPAMQAGAVSRPGFAEGAAIDLVEVW